MKKTIFFHPHKISKNPSKGSELRPKKMLEAFVESGYDVRLVVGESKSRKKAIKQIKNEIRNGKKFEFMYGESWNMPMPFGDDHHLPVRPLQDFRLFRYLRNNNIPVGFFYRDMFWRVKELRNRIPFNKRILKQILHRMEWFGLTKTVDHLFIPTARLARYLPTKLPETKWSALYPGCTPLTSNEKFENRDSENSKLKLIYVGGIEPTLYNLEQLLQVVSKSNDVYLKLCCRKKEWKTYAAYYKRFDLSNVKIIHAKSIEVQQHYKWADLAVCLWPRKGYINETMPIKIIETIGYEVPLILLEGSESADFVEIEQAGWVVKNVPEAQRLLNKLKNNKNMIVEKSKSLRKVNKRHTWEARAKEAADILTRD